MIDWGRAIIVPALNGIRRLISDLKIITIASIRIKDPASIAMKNGTFWKILSTLIDHSW